ncbi:transporter [Ochrobactrum sp. Q0168]|uniref:transporter n=1 Tax=Ochrobactrum sp. Q0168 TaxID=2793241 RepID=UPI0018EC3F28|nr:transporter [Ochrobactrum sp. Q0168]
MGLVIGIAVLSMPSFAQSANDDIDELARKVSNPASFMISVPVHSDLDFGSGSGKVRGFSLDIEPVIPMRLNDRWNVISHTDIPLVYSNPLGEVGSSFGLGDITQTFSFTPSAHGPIIWAIGPQLSFPTATDDLLGSGKFSLGPSGLLLYQSSAITTGLSANHIWSVLGSDSRPDVNQTELQPFIAWHIGKGRTISANLDADYDWTADQWTVPVSGSFSKIVKLDDQTMSLSLGAKYWLEGPDEGPKWGIKAGVTFLFPQTVK